MKFKRVYHNVESWEEVLHNMWGDVANIKESLQKAIAFTSDHEKYGSFMMRVVKEWPVSCENAMTDDNLNKKAWVGHAAVALALSIPEDITRKAWGHLTDEQRFLANTEAARAIRYWSNSYAESKNIHRNMGSQMLWPWHTG